MSLSQEFAVEQQQQQLRCRNGIPASRFYLPFAALTQQPLWVMWIAMQSWPVKGIPLNFVDFVYFWVLWNLLFHFEVNLLRHLCFFMKIAIIRWRTTSSPAGVRGCLQRYDSCNNFVGGPRNDMAPQAPQPVNAAWTGQEDQVITLLKMILSDNSFI